MVDDETFNLNSMKIVLQSALTKIGLHRNSLDAITDYVSDGKHALDSVKRLFEEEAELYGFILMDCQMPIMDGYQSCLLIREYLS